MKAAAEIFKLASRIGIKPRDIIGQGADVIKMGKSLFNTKVNPELTKFISNKGEIPTKILESIKVHLRSLKSVSENQLELFKLNLKDIVNAKFPKPVSSGKKLATEAEKDVAFIEDTIQSLNKTEAAADAFSASLGTRKYYLNELKNTYPKHYQRLTGKETTAELKEIIYRLDTEGIPFESGGMAKLNAELNQLPEYYLPMAEGGIANHFRKK